MRRGAHSRQRGKGRRLALTGSIAILVAVPTASIVLETVAAAAGPPTLVQAGNGDGTGSAGSLVPITATLPGSPCAAGDTLIAFVTVGEQVAIAGTVAATPPGWERLYEHAPSDTSPSTISPYQGWFALPSCSGQTSATFTISTPGSGSAVAGSVVLGEYANLPNPVAEDFATNTGNATPQTNGTLGGSSPAGSELILTGVSLYGQTPSSVSSGWAASGADSGGSVGGFVYSKVTSSTPSVTVNWSSPSAFELTMIGLTAGPASAAPNVVQENQHVFSGGAASVTLPGNPTAGDALVALIGTDDTSQNGSNSYEASGVSGGGVTTWQKVAGDAQSGNGTAEVWVGFGSSGVGSTVTATGISGSLSGYLIVSEVSGLQGTIDTSRTNASSGSSPGGVSFTPHVGDFLVGLMTANSSAVGIHPQPNWSTLSLSQNTYAAEWQSNVPHSSSDPTWMINPGGSFVAVQAGFIASDSVISVTGVSPNSGFTGGGTSVTVTGTGFTGVSAVDFGSTPSPGFTVNSTSSITATAPAESPGTVDVTVIGSLGTSSTSSNDQYSFVTVLRPVVSGVSPAFGSGKGGATVTVTGSNLLNASGVFFGSSPGTVQSVSPGGTSLVAITAPGTGTVDVTVTTLGGTSATSPADHYTYQGYWMVGSDGGVFAFGNAGFVGSLPGIHVHVSNIVGVVPTKDSGGYWMVGSDGGVFAFGDAGFVGSLPGKGVHINDIVGVVPTPTGKGYWMVGSDGGVFAFGDAGFVGSLPGINVHLNDIVGVVPTSTGKGYWMVGSDGGVFAFGDAGFVGSLPNLKVQVNDVVGVVPTSTGKGYWMVGSDGGVFAFGDAGFVGSIPGLRIHVSDIVGVVPTKDSGGYWMVGSDGGVFGFGDAGFVGSLPGIGVHVSNIVGVVPT